MVDSMLYNFQIAGVNYTYFMVDFVEREIIKFANDHYRTKICDEIINRLKEIDLVEESD